MAHVVILEEAREQHSKLPHHAKAGFQRVVSELAKWPNVSGAKPMRGRLKGRFRKRIGDYRLLFRIDGQTVVIEKVGHRKDIYE